MLSEADRQELIKAQAILNNRRAEYALEHDRPKPDQVRLMVQPIPTQPHQALKTWPVVIMAADQKKAGGAIRLYFIARMIDRRGSGKVDKAELWGWLKYFRVGDRKRRRWIAQAKAYGLLSETDNYYYLLSLGRAALAVGCDRVGRPAKISGLAMVSSGWRAHVWAAYLSTLHGRPVSQQTKERLTGVSERTQRNYQAALPGEKRGNYAVTKHKGDRLTMFREYGRGAAFVGRDGKIIFKLPDTRNVPGFIATAAPRGRSRKAQKMINQTSFYVERGNHDSHFRLFYDKNADRAARRIANNSDLPPWELPREVFEFTKAHKFNNTWRPIEVIHHG